MFWKATEDSPRMFESDFIDSFSRVPWWVVPVTWMPITAAFLGFGFLSGASPLAMVAQFAAGVFVWSLLEYWLHRTLFHWVPPTSWGEQFHFYLHGVHHKWVNDKFRLVMPPAASVAIGAFVWAAFMGAGILAAPWVDSSWTYGTFAGVAVGYQIYDLAHYYIHHAAPRFEVLKLLRAHHMAHHHNPKFQEAKFGVSSTFWDHVFRTY